MAKNSGSRAKSADAIILGGGLVGLAQALALAAHGLRCIVVDRADPEKMLAAGFDGRASAVSSASWNMLEAIGLAPRLAGKGCAIRRIRVSDGLKPGKLDFAPGEDEGSPLGIMFENRLLRRSFYEAAREQPLIELFMPAEVEVKQRGEFGVTVGLAGGEELGAPLLIAADGRASATREEAGLKVARWRYEHEAIIGVISHAEPHANTAYEIFYPTGPFAILPLADLPEGGHRSAFVWSLPRGEAPLYMKLGERAFAAEIAKASGGFLGEIELITPRASYPLGFHHTAKITARRLALIGDSAHAIHPIAGQGLNLGFRDVAALAEILVEGRRWGMDLGDAQLLARYERWRSLDALSVAAATDSLTRLFGIRGEAAAWVRRFGIGIVDRLPPAKNFFMAEARGEAGQLPKLLEGAPV